MRKLAAVGPDGRPPVRRSRGATTANGEPLVKGYRVTVFFNEEEHAIGLVPLARRRTAR